jgi:hypothetical protein
MSTVTEDLTWVLTWVLVSFCVIAMNIFNQKYLSWHQQDTCVYRKILLRASMFSYVEGFCSRTKNNMVYPPQRRSDGGAKTNAKEVYFRGYTIVHLTFVGC